MPRLVIRDPADADIDEIADFIARDNLDAGRRFYDAVWRDLQRLAEMPQMGGAPDVLATEAREPSLVAHIRLSELPHPLPGERRRH